MKHLRLQLLWLIPLAVAVFAGVDSGITGHAVDSYRNVPVMHNGVLYGRSHGASHAADGSYLGQKWQCVEYIRRFYQTALGHSMPDGTGHAKDYFNPDVPDGGMNKRRGMLQFHNGGTTPPQADDLLVFRGGTYGHVAIIIRVTGEEVEIIQQNIYARPRQTLALSHDPAKGTYTIRGKDHAPAGWLRLPGK